MKKILILLSILIITFFLLFRFSNNQNTMNKETSSNNTNVDNFNNVEMSYATDMPLEYFEGDAVGGNGESTYLEKMGYQGEIIPVVNDVKIDYENLNDPLEGFNNLPDMYELHEPYWGEAIDVDGDSALEKVFYYSTAMNHIPHVVNVVKNNNVIFRASGPSIELVKTENGDGFYTEEYIWNDTPAASTRITRYIYENGEFLPVWYRKIYVLEIKNKVNQLQGYLPLEKGDYWKYEGIRIEENENGKIVKTDINKEITVDKIESVGNKTYVYLEKDDEPAIIIQNNTIDFEPNNLSNDKFSLTFPLKVGTRWGNDVGKRDDGYYSWEIEKKIPRNVLGKDYEDCYRISYKTLPDTSYKVFCYGIGIVEEGYIHNGTILEDKYNLVDTNIIN